MESFLFPFYLTLVAGLSTGLGSAVVFFLKRDNATLLATALGFSAGMMVYVSTVELFPQAKTALVDKLGDVTGSWVAVGAFFFGMLLIGIIDKLIPSYENPHEPKKTPTDSDPTDTQGVCSDKLMRMGLVNALAIAIHNFPEGMATFTSTMKDPSLGILIALAIGIHNIPEGIAIAVPVYCATGSKRRSIRLSFLAGLSEPVGALVGFLLLKLVYTELVSSALLAAVAGIMVFISLDELLPMSRAYGKHHHSVYGWITGMAVMAISLLLFEMYP